MKTTFTYLVGPTYLIEMGPFRLLTDPGFDPEGTERDEGPGHLLRKVMAPPLPVKKLGRIDAVLLSHQHHYDNLDNTGRDQILPLAGRVVTHPQSAAALGGKAEALETWQTTELKRDGKRLRITATPAIHTNQPELREAVGETTGFMLEWDGADGGLYLSGDTVWFEGLEEVIRRYKIGAAVLHLGAANVDAVGDARLTMNAEEGVRFAQRSGVKAIYPAHFEGWLHFKQGRSDVERIFREASMEDVVRLLDPGASETLQL